MHTTGSIVDVCQEQYSDALIKVIRSPLQVVVFEVCVPYRSCRSVPEPCTSLWENFLHQRVGLSDLDVRLNAAANA